MNRQKWKKLPVGATGMVNQMESGLHQVELDILCKTSQLIGQSLNLDKKLEIVLETLSGHLFVKRAAITLKHEKGHFPSIVASNGLRLEDMKTRGYGLEEGAIGRIFRTSQALVAPDISKDPFFPDRTGSRRIEKGQISFVGVPIILHSICVGVLSVERFLDEDVSFEGDIRFLTILAALIAQFFIVNGTIKSRGDNYRKSDSSCDVGISEQSKQFFHVGSSRSMSWVKELIRKVAPTKANVLLLGESGTGKTLIAKTIHDLSNRASLSFIKVNCAAFPDDLLESELFGYERGALVGGAESRSGGFEAADGGTMFLDEIGEVPIHSQLKLLRFLQDCEFERQESETTNTVDVRIIAATSRDLGKAVVNGSFREDLYHRLNVFPIRIPPLQERREDIAPLINFFAQRIDRKYKCTLNLTDAALDALANYSWPGNVRELENLIERLAIMFSGETIDIGDLLPFMSGSGEDLETRLWQGKGSLREREKRDVVTALAKNRWILVRGGKGSGYN